MFRIFMNQFLFAEPKDGGVFSAPGRGSVLSGHASKHPVTPDMQVDCSSAENMNTLILWTDQFQRKEDREGWTSFCYSVQGEVDNGCIISDGIGG